MPIRTDVRNTRALAALAPYHILGTPPEPAFDVYPQLLCAAFDAGAAVLAFFEGDRLWIKAKAGTQPFDYESMMLPLTETFESGCARVINNPPNLYCGTPIRALDGCVIGVLGAFAQRDRLATPAPNPLIDIVATAVMHALEARKAVLAARSTHALPLRTNRFAVSTRSASIFEEDSIAAVLTKIEAGRRLLRSDHEQLHDTAQVEAFVSAMRQLLAEDGEPHILVMFCAPGNAAVELVEQARRARLLCDDDLIAVVDGTYVTMLLRNMPVAVGYQAAKRFARAQLNTSFSINAVRGPIADARTLFDTAIATLRRAD
jgi:hypothetical protein